jgi:subtilisin family serine protease
VNTRHLIAAITFLVLLLSCPVFASVRICAVTTGHERIEFIPQPEKGYVVRTTGVRRQESGVRRLHTASMPTNAVPIGGVGRNGLWVVENEQSGQVTPQGQQISYQAPLFSVNGQIVAVIPEIVIRVRPGIDVRQVHFLCQSLGLAVIKPMEFTTQEYLLQVLGSNAEAVFSAVERLNAVDVTEWAAPNTASELKLSDQDMPTDPPSGGVLHSIAGAEDANVPGVFPNDEYFPLQWHLHNTGQSGGTPGADTRAPEAWEITTGDPNVVIALFDCGVDTRHPDLVDNLMTGHDF